MKILTLIGSVAMMLFVAFAMASASDFDWVKDFNIRAEADPSGFRAGLTSRFQVGDAEIGVVLGDVKDPSDAYMIFRLGEMSHHPVERVMREYKSRKGQGWGVIAQSLGIKPGSAEFHALKKGHDLRYGDDDDKGKDKDLSKDKDKEKDKGKGKKK